VKPLIIALLAALSFPSAASDCHLSGLPKIIGLDYHTARAKLINAGCMPAIFPIDELRDGTLRDDAAALGYFEADIPGSGDAFRPFYWLAKKKPFTVTATGCENVIKFRCVVHSISAP
jgi:hypothetical protein